MSITSGVRIVLFFIATTCLAEASTNSTKSTELHPDRRVSFRLSAPKATQVKLWGDWITRFNTTEVLTKNDTGVWTATIGPLPPGKHSYVFLVDGLVVLDPNNPGIALGREGAESNLIDIPGDGPLSEDKRNVPHGAVHMHWYQSSIGLGQRRFIVYTPPNYGSHRGAKYPILVLLHGSGNTEAAWTDIGKANFIADNLIAQKRMLPILIVMPMGHNSAIGDGPLRNADDNNDRVEDDLLRDVIPMVKALYHVKGGSQFCAIAGPSMGGFQALAYGTKHPEVFANIGVFSAGAHGEEGRKQTVEAIGSGNLRHIRLFWIGTGSKDPLLKDAQALDGILQQHNIKHQFVITAEAGHTWMFWRQCLADFLPKLFR